MIKRILPLPTKTFLLFGPRGTGKSTWLRQSLPKALYIDLLDSRRFLELSQDPAKLRELTAAKSRGDWIIIDEIQRIPALLSEVHALYEERRLQFALSGSSARKIKRGGADLLAGRALQTFLFPMVHAEYSKHYSLADALEWGTLPLVITAPDHRPQTLATYVETYLREELVAEALIRKLEPFIRFLRTAGLYNCQILNIENIARQSTVKRTTVDRYFEILEDTLIGSRLPAYRAGIKTKETTHPKFYFFDVGVARAAAGLVEESVDSMWRGFALESLMLNELRAYNKYFGRNRDISHYSVAGSYDIDFVIETRRKTLSKPAELILIEVKLGRRWDSAWAKPLNDFSTQVTSKVARRICVYLGDDHRRVGDVEVFPAVAFLEELSKGKIF